MIVPETVALVAMGSSRMNYAAEAMKAGGRRGIADETWVINKLATVYRHDVVFRMDDLVKPRDCNMRQGKNKDEDRTIHDTQTDWMRTHNKPIITSTAYPDFPSSIEYPLEDVINTIGYSYFLTTPAYAAAYAIHIGVKTLKVYGCDYVYPNSVYLGESGRANMEFILAIGMMSGMKVEVAQSSTLLETCRDISEHMYGYEHIIEVVESEEEGKRYEIKHRQDLTDKLEKEQKERDRQTLQSLISKYKEDVTRDLVAGNWITKDDIDRYSDDEHKPELLDAFQDGTTQEESPKGE